MIPEVLHRCARKDSTEESPASVCDDDTNHRIARDPEAAMRKDAKVLQQDGAFRAAKGKVVDPDRSPEPFEVQDFVVVGECVVMTAHAIPHCTTC